MLTVLHALNSIEANLVKGLLESEGITSHIHGEFLQGGVGELPADNLIRVVVNDSDYEKARAIIEDWREAKFLA